MKKKKEPVTTTSMAKVLAESRKEYFLTLTPTEVALLRHSTNCALSIRRLLSPEEYAAKHEVMADLHGPVLSEFDVRPYESVAAKLRADIKRKRFFFAFCDYTEVHELSLGIASETNKRSSEKPRHEVSVSIEGVAPIRSTGWNQLQREGWLERNKDVLSIRGFDGQITRTRFHFDDCLRQYMIEQFGPAAYYENALTVIYRVRLHDAELPISFLCPPIPNTGDDS